MGWPDLTYRGRLEPELRNELEQLVALVIGWNETEHGPDGEHTAITVDSITVRPDGTVTFLAPNGTALVTIGVVDGALTITVPPAVPPALDTVPIVLPTAQINDVLVGHHQQLHPLATFFLRAAIDLNTDAPAVDSGLRWIVAAATDAASLGANKGALFFGTRSVTTGGEGIALYFNPASETGYVLSPPAGRVGLGVGFRFGSRLNPSMLWDEINGKVVYARDGYLERGRAVAQGEWIPVAYNAANFAGLGGMVVTVDAADQRTYTYTLVGKTMTLSVAIDNFSISGTPFPLMDIAIPDGYLAAQGVEVMGSLFDGAWVPAIISSQTGGARVLALRLDHANFTPSVDGTVLHFTITFPIQ